MRLTSSFAVFRFQPGEEGLAKARWHSREGKSAEAEKAYRAALAADPELRSGWLELFELLRRDGRLHDALELAMRAEDHFGPEAAMPRAIKGAALAELGRTRDAIAALEEAIELDGNLALAWHEMAYAAYRAGEYARALLVLDRAFALEPHTDTLMLRGHILRAAGQYDAAEVAFEGAQQSAEHDVPRREAEREVAATRRAATLGGKKPRRFTARERAFADTGAVLLDAGTDPATPGPADDVPALLASCLRTLVGLVDALEWHPAVCGGVAPEDEPLAEAVAHAIGAQLLPVAALDPADRPLLVAVWNGGGREWAHQLARLDRWGSGYAFALAEAAGASEPADVIGTSRCAGDPAALHRSLEEALALPLAAAPVDPEILAIAANPLARWRARRSGTGPSA
ncbi:MAG TPA: tetratricopeptide repeat protein [Gemmatimonadales bacterium]|nr:tetratricopeptide repeat protein [Gemmatimonadales bacterium]